MVGPCPHVPLFIIIIDVYFTLRDTEREHEQGRGRERDREIEREREREHPKQALCCHSEPDMGHPSHKP